MSFSYVVMWQHAMKRHVRCALWTARNTHAATSPHNYNDVILLNVLTYNFSHVQCKLPDGRRPKYVGAFLSVI
jgi:hypothetical protein